MKVTKYEHACIVLEELGQYLVIDPGVLSPSFPLDLQNVAAVVVTHEHADHLDASKLAAILVINPDMVIFAPKEVLDLLTDVEASKVIAEPGSTHTAGSFALDFFGLDHAIIYETVPCANIGVMVNKTLYYPGDSFTNPEQEVKVLALPSGAPWMKVGEAMAFMKLIQPKVSFPTHDSLYNETGASSSNNWLSVQATALGIDYKVLKTGESINV